MVKESDLWFSHPEHLWLDMSEIDKAKIVEKNETFTWTWDKCYFSAVKISDNKVRVIIRSRDSIKIQISEEEYDNPFIVFLYDFDTADIPEIHVDENFSIPKNPKQNFPTRTGKRYVMTFTKEKRRGQVDGKCEIWQWKTDSELKALQKKIQEIINSDHKSPTIENEDYIQPTSGRKMTEIYPIIYQPAFDGPKNFLRQVHVKKKNEKKIQVTLVFNNETLRKNVIFHGFYEDFRKVVYGRTKDVETFHIILEDSAPKKFNFKGIYSKSDTNLENDTIHGDSKKWWQFWKKVPERKIDCYYTSTLFPKIYVNTANHALAGQDNNPGLWKWEYVTWGDDLPIGVGTNSRKDIENRLTRDSKVHQIKRELQKAGILDFSNK